MFHLQASIDLHKIELTSCRIKKKLDRSSSLIVTIANNLRRPRIQAVLLFIGNVKLWFIRPVGKYTRSFFNDLLIITLKTTLAFTKVNHISFPIAEHLDFNMTCTRDKSTHLIHDKSYFSTIREPLPKWVRASLLHISMS